MGVLQERSVALAAGTASGNVARAPMASAGRVIARSIALQERALAPSLDKIRRTSTIKRFGSFVSHRSVSFMLMNLSCSSLLWWGVSRALYKLLMFFDGLHISHTPKSPTNKIFNTMCFNFVVGSVTTQFLTHSIYLSFLFLTQISIL